MEIFFIVLICAIVFYIISEFFGRSKHIGKGWTFALLITSFIFGIIALIASPSAHKEPTKGNKNHQIFGWISIVFGAISIFTLNPLSIGLIVLGFYLIELSKNKIINKNPKFYFDSNPIQKHSKSIKYLNSNAKNDSNYLNDFHYYIIENDKPSEPLSYEELKNKKISEGNFVWRKGLDKWIMAKDLEELSQIIIYQPPPFKTNFENSENSPKFDITIEEEEITYKIKNKLYKIEEIEYQFMMGNYILNKKDTVELDNGQVKEIIDLPAFKTVLSYFPPKLDL